MSDDNNSGPEGQNEEVQKQEQQQPQVDVKGLETQIAKLTKDLDNARKGERFAKSTKEELHKRVEELELITKDTADWKTKYEQAEEKLKGQALDAAIAEAAKEAKAKDVKAILKLVDRASIAVKDGVADAKAVQDAVSKAKQEYGLLFEKVDTPNPARASEGGVLSDYMKEIRAAKSQKEIEEVMKRHKKL